jgi:hypothetical protein
MVIEADVVDRKAECCRDRLAARRGVGFARHCRDGEACAAMVAAFRDDAALHRPDLFLEHDVVAGTTAQRQYQRGADGRMAGERHFPAGRENARARRAAGRFGLEHEHRFRMIELARDDLHRRVVDAVGVKHHAERIAGKAFGGEDVERGEI